MTATKCFTLLTFYCLLRHNLGAWPPGPNISWPYARKLIYRLTNTDARSVCSSQCSYSTVSYSYSKFQIDNHPNTPTLLIRTHGYVIPTNIDCHSPSLFLASEIAALVLLVPSAHTTRRFTYIYVYWVGIDYSQSRKYAQLPESYIIRSFKPTSIEALRRLTQRISALNRLLCLRPHMAEALSDDAVWRLSVWRLLRTPGISREERGLGRLKLEQRYSPRHTWLGHHFQGQKVKGQLVADGLNSQHAGTRTTWRIRIYCQLAGGGGILWRSPAPLVGFESHEWIS